MTLIELSVVLLILVGLAGLLIPYVGSFVQKTHDSTTSANFGMLNNAFNRFVVEKNRMPHHVESLINSSAADTNATGNCTTATLNTIYCGLFNTALFEAVNWSSTSGATQIESLNKAGLSMMVNNNPNVPSKTFGLGSGMVYTNTSTANFYVAKVAAATDLTGMGATQIYAHLQKALGGAGMDYNTTCYDYIAVGLGDNVELAGNTLTGASPIGFPEEGEQGPSYGYGHYIGILQVDKSNAANQTFMSTAVNCSPITEKAKFIGTVLNVPSTVAGHLVGLGETLTKAHDNMVETKKIE